MAIEQDEIEKLAELARIRIEDDQISEVTERITAILAMVDQLQAVDTSEVAPMASPLDASQRLPFPEAYFDAILCANSLNFYGTDLAVVDRLARYLKRSGVFCSGGECLSREFTPEQIADPPAVYSFAEPVWAEDFMTLHSPDWWAEHLGGSKELQLVSCRELEDGRVFYEEQALVSEPEGYFGLSAQEARELEIRQIEYGREQGPAMTIHLLVARRR